VRSRQPGDTEIHAQLALEELNICDRYSPGARVTLHHGDCRDLLRELHDNLPESSCRLIVTSPPYNIGKRYERRKDLDTYLEQQAEVIALCVSVLSDEGSICWQVGNHIAPGGEVYPLDTLLYPIFKQHGLYLRNRIIWHFEHGLHCSKRFSGRYETILWFTKGSSYVFNLDAVRVPQKYPGKRYYKGPKKGKYSSDPRGKNPSDLWQIPNVKHNHVEKTIHPCQFPVELIERLVLSMTNPGDLVLDPYMGVGTTAVAAIKHSRRAAGADVMGEYIEVARERVVLAARGALRTRPMSRPVYEPSPNSTLVRRDDLSATPAEAFDYQVREGGDGA